MTSAQVDNGSLSARDFKNGELIEGPAGPAGQVGPTGPPGGQGLVGPRGPTGSPGANAISTRGTSTSDNVSIGAASCGLVALGFNVTANDRILFVTPVDPPASVIVAPVIAGLVARVKVCNISSSAVGPFTLVVNYAVS